MAILTGPVKRSIMARLISMADPGGPLDGVQVVRSLPPDPDRQCVYGGRAQWLQRDVVAERGLLYEQTITFEIRVRVVELGDDVDGTEKIAEDIASLVSGLVVAAPSLVPPGGSIVVSSGDQDPTMLSPNPEPSVTANLALTVTVVVTAGP